MMYRDPGRERGENGRDSEIAGSKRGPRAEPDPSDVEREKETTVPATEPAPARSRPPRRRPTPLVEPLPRPKR